MWQLFWQWMNQSYNAGFNYANRNASVETNMHTILKSYGVATGTAVAAAFGLGKVVENLQAKVGDKPSFGLKLLSRGLPWFAVATAGAVNAVVMRLDEAEYVCQGFPTSHIHSRIVVCVFVLFLLLCVHTTAPPMHVCTDDV